MKIVKPVYDYLKFQRQKDKAVNVIFYKKFMCIKFGDYYGEPCCYR